MLAAIYIPGFYLQSSLRHAPLPGHPVAIVDESENTPRIVQFNQAARRAGIRKGMTSTQGLARFTALQIRYRSYAQERLATAALLQCAASTSPCIEATADGVCTVDWKGLPQSALLKTAQNLLDQLRRQELIAKIGIATTPGLALLAAHIARPLLQVTHPWELHDLPISALAPTPALHRALRKLGIRRLRQFSQLPPDGISLRFGEEALLHWKCITGKGTRLLHLISPPDTFEEATEFEHEIELLDPLLFTLRRFLDRLTDRLSAAYLAAATLDLRIGFTAGPDYTHAFPIPSPTCHVETLFRMLQAHLDSLQTPHPIKSLHLSATPSRPVKDQLGLFETSLRDPNQFHQTLARLSALISADHAGSPVKENTFRPDAFSLQLPVFNTNPLRKISPPRGLALRRFRPARSARVFTVNSRPASLTLEDFSAPLAESAGPWITSGEWWDRQAWERTEWEVESTDHQFHRLLQQNGAWYAEGIYD